MENKKITVSVVTPSFNQGQFIEDTIRSVISQEGEFLIDYIIMDGGSQDNSVEVIRKYDSLLKSNSWPLKCGGIKFRWVSERDGGHIDALEKGFAKAEGELGVWLNSDDIFYDSQVFAKVLSEFGRDDALQMLTGDGPFIDKDGREFGLHHVDEIDFTELLYLDYHILQPATFVKQNIYKNEHLDPAFGNFCFDAEYYIRLIAKGYKYKKVNDKFACFRLYPETKTLSGLGKRYRTSLKISRAYGKNYLYFAVSALYKYFEIVLQNKYPDNKSIKKILRHMRPIAYRTILGRWDRAAGQTVGQEGKKVLFFFPHNPFPPKSGAHKRCLEMLAGLRDIGCKVTLASSTLFSETEWTESSINSLKKEWVNDVRVHYATPADLMFKEGIRRIYELFRRKPTVNSIMYTPPGMRKWFKKAVKEISPDIILMNYSHWDGLMDHHKMRPITRVIETHDLVTLNLKMWDALSRTLPGPPMESDQIDESVLEESFFEKLGLEAEPHEFRIFDKYDFTLTLCEREAEKIRKNAHKTRTVLIPITHEPVYLANTYSGNALFPTGPNPFNAQGYFYFLKKVMPLIEERTSSFRLQVTGHWCSRIKPESRNILFSGFVPDMRDAYASSRFLICPLIGGTGQQVKIIEAMAHGVPVIALKFAAESSPIRHGINGLIASNAEEFAGHVIRLWNDKALCRKMGEAARETIASQFSRDLLIERLSVITGEPCCRISFDNGWYAPEVNGPDIIRWSPGRGEIMIFVPKNYKSGQFALNCELISIHNEDAIDIMVNGRKTTTIDLKRDAWEFTPYQLTVSLNAGQNIVELNAHNNAVRLSGDERELSVAVKNLSVQRR